MWKKNKNKKKTRLKLFVTAKLRVSGYILLVDHESTMTTISKFTIFALFYFCIRGQIPSTSPPGAYIRRGDLTEDFLRYDFGGLIFGGANIHGGAYFRILRYVKTNRPNCVALVPRLNCKSCRFSYGGEEAMFLSVLSTIIVFWLFSFVVTVSAYLCVVCRHFYCPMSLFQGQVACRNLTLTGPIFSSSLPNCELSVSERLSSIGDISVKISMFAFRLGTIRQLRFLKLRHMTSHMSRSAVVVSWTGAPQKCRLQKIVKKSRFVQIKNFFRRDSYLNVYFQIRKYFF